MRARACFVGMSCVLVVLSVAQAPAAVRTDRRAPVVRNDYPDNQSVFSSNTSAGGTSIAQWGSSYITGRATDDLSGIGSITLTFYSCELSSAAGGSGTCTKGAYSGAAPCAKGCNIAPRVTCNRTRLSCIWGGYAPMYPGTYVLVSWAKDRKGNVGKARAIRILVL